MLTEELESASAALSRRSRELQEKTEILQCVLDGMADGVVAADRSGKVLVFNPAAERLLGDDNIGRPTAGSEHYSFHSPNADRRCLAEDEIPLTRALSGESFADSEVLVRRAGESSDSLLSVTGGPLRNSDGIFAGLIVLRDITEKRRGEQNQTRLAGIVEMSEDAILSFGMTGLITSWNRGAESLYGYPASEMIGESVCRLMPPEGLAELEQIFQNAAAKRQVGHFETVRLAKNGSRILVSLSASHLSDSAGRVVGVSTIARDISQFKRVERELQSARDVAEAATRAKSEFLANVSHEVRTPLTAILGFAELLLGASISDSERLNYLMTVRRNGEHLLSVLDDVLDFSKIEAGKMTVELIATSPTQILHEVTSLMRVRAIDKGLELNLEYQTPIPVEVISDPTRLKQILLNLVSNAIKFTREGSVKILASCEGPKTAQPRLIIRILDTGIGMSQQELDGLFKPFAQADTSTTRRFGGTGLGLGICRPLALALGGEISVATTPGQGSCFSLTLKLPPLSSMSMVSDVLFSVPLRKGATKTAISRRLAGSVLLAEDGPDNQLLIASILRKRGASVTVAENGRLAIDLCMAATRDEKPYDLILMDMQMPEVDGHAATAYLRAKGYRGPIVALTANAMAGERERCLKSGCTDYMTKPIQMGSFLNLVVAYLPESNFVRGAPSGTFACALAIDDEVLRSSFADDPEMTVVLAKFLERLRTEVVEQLRSACEPLERNVLKRLAHQLKGAGSGYGFAEITAAAAALEAALHQESACEEVARRTQVLRSLCQRVSKVGLS
jgi:PAS domain S-box-containing protein